MSGTVTRAATPERGYEVRSNEEVPSEALEEQARGEDLEALLAALPLAGVRRVLEVGCGVGSLTRRLATELADTALEDDLDRGHDAVEVVGLDIAAEHVDEARRLAHGAGRHAPRFVQGDFLADPSPFVERRFDLVLEKYLLMYLEPRGDAPRFFARAREVLRPGGRLALIEADVDFGGERHPPPPEPLATVLPEVVRHYRRAGTIEWRCGLRLHQLLRDAGFREVEVRLVDGRIIAGGRPRALAEHACRDVEALLAPCVESLGLDRQLDRVCRQWCDYLRSPASFLYTPIFLGVGSV